MRIRDVFSKWDWGLLFFVLLYAILPTIYRSYSIYLVGNTMPGTDALAIVSQWQFVQVFFEIIQEAIVLPLFFFVGRNRSGERRNIAISIKTALLAIFVLVGVVVLIIELFLPQFVEVIGTDASIAAETNSYLRILLIGTLFNVVTIGSVIIVESLNKKKVLLIMAFVNIALSIFFDSLFFGGYSFSLDMGVVGVAYSYLIVNAIMFLVAFVLLLRSIKTGFLEFLKLPVFRNLKLLGSIGLGSGIDSAVRNTAYIFMIIRILNLLGPEKIGGYYLAMHLFWGFALVPVLAIAETTKALMPANSHDKSSVKNIVTASLILTGIVVIVWGILASFWSTFAGFFNDDAEIISYSFKAFQYLIIPYILFAFNTVLDSLFYGLGRTRYMAYQSIITNGTVYVIAFVLYIVNVWQPNFESIMILFGVGLLVDSIFTVYYARRVIKHMKVHQV
jgi:Na+-driven multidrug efflux pump